MIELVKNDMGEYFIRKKFWFGAAEYLSDMTFWWSDEDEVLKFCPVDSEEKALKRWRDYHAVPPDDPRLKMTVVRKLTKKS